MEGRLWRGNGRDRGRWEWNQAERKETEQEKDIGMTTKKRYTGHTHIEKDQKKKKDNVFVKSHACVLSCSVVSDSLKPHGLQPARLLCPWDLSSQEYWNRLPFLPPENLPDSGFYLSCISCIGRWVLHQWKSPLGDSTALNSGISYSADKVENSTVFRVKSVIRK